MNGLIKFYDAYKKEDELLFSNMCLNAFQKMNIHTGKIETIDMFPGCTKEKRELHLCVLNYRERLYFIPYKSNMIHIWNLESEQWEDNIKLSYSESVKIEDAVLYENEIWIFPNSLDKPIIKFNMDRKTSVELDELTKSINERASTCVKIVTGCVCLEKNMLFIATYDAGYVFKINIKNLKIENVFCFENTFIAGMKALTHNRLCIWFVNKSSIMIWDEEAREKKYLNIKTQIPFGRIAFRSVLELDEKYFLLLPKHSNELFVVDEKNGLSESLALPADFHRCSPYSLFEYGVKEGKKIYLFPSGGNKLLVIDLDNMKVCSKDFDVSKEYQEYASGVIRKQREDSFHLKDMYEAMGWNEVLPQFIDMVCMQEQQIKKDENANYGAKIYEVL